MLIMLFRMGQCLQNLFKKIREAEGYYRERERPCTGAHSRRIINGIDPLLASRMPTTIWKVVLVQVQHCWENS